MGSKRSNSRTYFFFNQASGASYLIFDELKKSQSKKIRFIAATARPLAFKVLYGRSERNATASSAPTFALIWFRQLYDTFTVL
jgi:hypothetical protein